MKYILIIFLCCLIFSHHKTSAQQSKNKTDTSAIFDAYVQQSIKDWQVPGLAIVVVKDNQVVFKKTYGTKVLGKDLPVDNQTLFACASTTKAMTATCMGILVDQGKVSWDDPVIKYLPAFKLYDPYMTREIRIRDLFLHNSGLGNTDYLWSKNNLSADEIVARLQLVKPSYGFRAGFIYQNIFYLVAGQVIEKISGLPWDEFITKNIFVPLGMNRTKAKLSMVKDPNITGAHFKIDGTVQLIEHDTADVVGAAGSVLSCLDDITRWLSCMLDSSKYTGGRLVKPATFRELFRPQTFVTETQFYPTQKLTAPNFTTYALGWFQQDYKGKKLNFHTGSLSGAVAIHAQIPEVQTGVYIFANLDHAELRHALLYKAFDQFALGGNRDWNKECLGLYTSLKNEAEAKEKIAATKRVQHTNPSLPLAAYVGSYADTLYGTIEITLSNNQLVLNLNKSASGILQHWNYDTFQLIWQKKWYGKELLGFNLNTEGICNAIDFNGFRLQRVQQ
jgi:CubicO group peptidase (beta-lactamase class C family)